MLLFDKINLTARSNTSGRLSILNCFWIINFSSFVRHVLLNGLCLYKIESLECRLKVSEELLRQSHTDTADRLSASEEKLLLEIARLRVTYFINNLGSNF